MVPISNKRTKKYRKSYELKLLSIYQKYEVFMLKFELPQQLHVGFFLKSMIHRISPFNAYTTTPIFACLANKLERRSVENEFRRIINYFIPVHFRRTKFKTRSPF